MDERTDAVTRALLDGVRAKDRDAVSALFDRFERDVNRLVWALLGADADHDDLVAAVFEQLLKGVSAVKSASAINAWVRQVTVNTVRTELRKRRWRRLFARDEEQALSYPDLRIPDEAQRERTRALYTALGRLGGEDRTLLVLRHLEGLELTELADALGTSVSTVKRQLARAEARLAAVLGRSES